MVVNGAEGSEESGVDCSSKVEKFAINPLDEFLAFSLKEGRAVKIVGTLLSGSIGGVSAWMWLVLKVLEHIMSKFSHCLW